MDQTSLLEAMARMSALMSTDETPDLEELEKEHQPLVESLKEFHRDDVMAVVSALLTYPQFHANTIRLETFQQLAQRNCAGKNKPTRHRFSEWLKAFGEGWAARMEDPVEDVFISNVVTNIGNSRVFEGIWEANDFWLQQALDALRALRDEEWAHDLFGKINALLAVSEALARRCNLQRFVMGTGATRVPLEIPAEAELWNRAKQVRFSHAELDEIGAPIELLEDFIHDDSPATGTESDSTLQRRPLQKVDDGIIVAIPAAISPIIRLRIVDELIRVGKLEAYERVLFTRQINQLFGDGLVGLDSSIAEIEGLPPLPANTPATVQEILRFDEGKFAHVIFFQDKVLDFRERGVTGVLDLLRGYGDAILNHVQTCAAKISQRRDYQGGLSIAVVGGLGRSFLFGLGELPPHWYGAGFRLPDFLALSRVHRTKLLTIWKFREQQQSLNSRGIEFLNVNGELNLLGYWHAHGERLVQREVPFAAPTMIHVGTDFIGSVRQEMRGTYDFHAVPRRNPDVWVPVRRYNIYSHFKELDQAAIYADEDAVGQGRLRGVIETARRFWWLSTCEYYKKAVHRDIQFRIWEALLSWLPKMVSAAEADVEGLPEGPIEVLLRFSDLQTWQSLSLRDLPETSDDVRVRIVRRVPTVEVTIPAAFLRNFAQPKNIGERRLLDACFKGFAALANCVATYDRQTAVDRVVLNDDARFFHMAYAQDFRQHTSSSDKIKTRFVRDGDSNFAAAGVAQRLLGKTSNITGINACNDFLHRVVDDCWERIRSTLQNLSRESVVMRALRNVEAVEQDRLQWELTASAVLATHVDQEDVINAARKREHQRSETALASRVIVEMAVCTCPTSGYEISEAHLDALLGLVRLLLYAATSSDAITYGLTPPNVQVYPNGEFAADDHYYKTIIEPYTSEQFVGQFKESAESYAEYFVDPASRKVDRPQPFEIALVDAFKAEYGLTPDEFVDAYQALEHDAMPDERVAVSRTVEQIRNILIQSGLTSEVSGALFEKFALWPRSRWDETPKGFSKKDWYPWRYRRRLSLLSRPLVRVGDTGNAKVIFAPGLLRDCVELLLIRVMNGRLPAEAFQSAAMQSWIGEITRRRGDEFESQVGDEFRSVRFQALVSKPMTLFGADQKYGDLDTLAWKSDSPIVYAAECKRLRAAKTVAEIGEQLREFHGAELDRLSRHLRRCRWLEEHPDAVRRITKLVTKKIKIVPLLVTTTIVPMQFAKHLPLPTEQIVPFSGLREWLEVRSSLAAGS